MRFRVIAVLVVLGVIAAACGNSKSSKAAKTTTTAGGGTVAVNEPGVTDTEIRVGGIASINNPLNQNYGAIYDGVDAYFEMVNSAGGIYGRKLKLVARRDDQLANGKSEAEGLLAQDNPFVALPIAELLFTASDVLAKANIPTFGWNVNKEWTGPPNFFEQEGALCFDCPGVGLPWLAKKIGKKKLGVLAYSVEQSSDCAKGIKASFDKYPVATIAWDDRTLPFSSATDFSTDVKKMKDAGVDMVTTCMDQNGVLGVTREMKKQGLDVVQYLPNAYDHDFMASYGDLFEGAYVRTRFAPFETTPQPPGLKLFDKWMKKTGKKEVEISYVGWIDADMFVTGLKAAGKNFTRQKIVDALNKLTDYNADGILPGLDWTKQHGDPHLDQYKTPEDCSAMTQIKNKKFVPVFNQPGKPFICFPDASRAPTVPDAPTNKA